MMVVAGIFQFTPPRRGRHAVRVGAVVVDDISIHAPAQGATGYVADSGYVGKFQFTPPRRGRQ